ncbi:MAG: hypothetical protein ACTHU0_21935 [Kofleriaceae bacterium]
MAEPTRLGTVLAQMQHDTIATSVDVGAYAGFPVATVVDKDGHVRLAKQIHPRPEKLNDDMASPMAAEPPHGATLLELFRSSPDEPSVFAFDVLPDGDLVVMTQDGQRHVSRRRLHAMLKARAALENLSGECFTAFGPASRYGEMAKANAGAVMGTRDQPMERYFSVLWGRARAADWRALAKRTDVELVRATALAAADALDELGDVLSDDADVQTMTDTAHSSATPNAVPLKNKEFAMHIAPALTDEECALVRPLMRVGGVHEIARRMRPDGTLEVTARGGRSGEDGLCFMLPDDSADHSCGQPVWFDRCSGHYYTGTGYVVRVVSWPIKAEGERWFEEAAECAAILLKAPRYIEASLAARRRALEAMLTSGPAPITAAVLEHRRRHGLVDRDSDALVCKAMWMGLTPGQATVEHHPPASMEKGIFSPVEVRAWNNRMGASALELPNVPRVVLEMGCRRGPAWERYRREVLALADEANCRPEPVRLAITDFTRLAALLDGEERAHVVVLRLLAEAVRIVW